MSPIDAAIIRRKLQRIAASLDGLRPVARLSLEEYRARFYERKATERLLQEAIEAALDVNAHLIAELGGEVPEEYYGGFLKVGQLGVLPVDLAGALAPSAGARRPPGPHDEADRRPKGLAVRGGAPPLLPPPIP